MSAITKDRKAYQRAWRLKNPESYQTSYHKSNNSPKHKAWVSRKQGLKTLRRLKSSSHDRLKMCQGRIEEAIMRSHVKGRDMGTIAVMLNIPISVIANVIASHKTQ